jgi:hypothetical protein
MEDIRGVEVGDSLYLENLPLVELHKIMSLAEKEEGRAIPTPLSPWGNSRTIG